MNNIILEELKRKLKEKENKEKLKREKEIRTKELNVQKLYLNIWKYILDNIAKEEFRIYIYLHEELMKQEEYFTMIKVDNLIKNITRIKIDKNLLESLLAEDNLSYKILDTLKNGKISIRYEIPITTQKLKDIIDSKEKQKVLSK